MGILEVIDCLTAMLIGVHYAKPRFSVANYFNEILDLVADLPNFQVLSFEGHQISFLAGNIKTSISQNNIILNSNIGVGASLLKYLPRKKSSDVDLIGLPMAIYGTNFDPYEKIEKVKGAIKDFRKEFLEQSKETISLVNKIIEDGIPDFRFVGLMEFYAVPLDHFNWLILDKFTEQAGITGGINTEKIAINRYYFPTEPKGDETCLIFRLSKPNIHYTDEANVGGASFDFQYIPEKPKTVEGMGGVGEMINFVSKGISDIISKSRFMELSFKEVK